MTDHNPLKIVSSGSSSVKTERNDFAEKVQGGIFRPAIANTPATF